ncbi:PQQ-binding-like beta-propeller repeat protein [bacterium]|nr:PQQ-binding-like beta-propeller repeat protein [bacterium]MBU1852860.1 PQQ-binding-like beta-propeller repeat protein [Candidatus Omnitrophota bacterium]
MMNFKRINNLKVRALFICLLFILNTSVYGIEISNKTHLRIPFATAMDSDGVRGGAPGFITKFQYLVAEQWIGKNNALSSENRREDLEAEFGVEGEIKIYIVPGFLKGTSLPAYLKTRAGIVIVDADTFNQEDGKILLQHEVEELAVTIKYRDRDSEFARIPDSEERKQAFAEYLDTGDPDEIRALLLSFHDHDSVTRLPARLVELIRDVEVEESPIRRAEVPDADRPVRGAGFSRRDFLRFTTEMLALPTLESVYRTLHRGISTTAAVVDLRARRVTAEGQTLEPGFVVSLYTVIEEGSWPYSVGGGMKASVTLLPQETGYATAVVNKEGSEVTLLNARGEGITITLPGGTNVNVDQPIAIGDFNGDGQFKLVIMRNIEDGVDVIAVDINTGTVEWQQEIPGVTSGRGVAVGNNVIGAGQQIVAVTGEKVVLLDSGNGNVIWEKEFLLSDSKVPPVLADVTGDGLENVIVADMERVYVLDRFGEILWSTESLVHDPISGNKIEHISDIVAGDIDGDGKIKIVVGTGNQSTPTGYGVDRDIYVLDGQTGEVLHRHEISVLVPLIYDVKLSLGDVMGDGIVRIVATYGYGIIVLNPDLTTLWETSVDWRWYPSAAAIADIDDDGICEVIVPFSRDDKKYLGAWRGDDGTEIEEFTLEMEQNWTLQPGIRDFDGDGRMELVINAETSGPGNIYAFEVIIGSAGLVEWEQDRGDGRKTGYYGEAPSPIYIGMPTIAWQYKYGGAGSDEFHRVIRSSAGGYIIAGNKSINDGEVAGWIVKFDTNGVFAGEFTFGSIGNNGFRDIIETGDGGFLAAGWGYDQDGRLYMRAVKLSSDLEVEWESMFGVEAENIYAKSVVEADDGGYVFVGTANDYIFVIKIDSSGEVVWREQMPSAHDICSYASDIARRQGGGFIVVGSEVEETFNYSTDIVVYNLDEFGQVEGGVQYISTATHESMNCIIPTADGGFIMGGWVRWQPDWPETKDALVIKFGHDLNVEWKRQFYVPTPLIGVNFGAEEITSIIELPDGRYVVVGSYKKARYPLTGTHDVFVAVLRPDGTVEGIRILTEHDDGINDIVRDIMLGTDGRYVMVGATENNSAGGLDGWVFGDSKDIGARVYLPTVLRQALSQPQTGALTATFIPIGSERSPISLTELHDTVVLFLGDGAMANPEGFRDALSQLPENNRAVVITDSPEDFHSFCVDFHLLDFDIFIRTPAQLGLADFDLEQFWATIVGIDLQCIPLADDLCSQYKALERARDEV